MMSIRVRPWWSITVGVAALISYPLAPICAADASAPASAAAATTCTPGDLSGDGLVDLAVGAPGEDVGRANEAGAVNVLLGRGDGTFGGGLYLTQESVGQVSETGDAFGTAVVVADVTYDGCSDLVVGAPGENAAAGQVVVVHGSSTGITGTRRAVLRQGYAGATGTAEPGDRFGAALAVDVNWTGPRGLALYVGAPGEDIGALRDAGTVSVYPASPLTTRGTVQLYQGRRGWPIAVGGVAEAGDQFGASLGGSRLIGSPGEDVGTVADAGSVYALTWKVDGYVQITQNSPGVPDTAEAGDRFGAAVATAYPTCYLDLAEVMGTQPVWVVGAPGEDVGGHRDVGYVAHQGGRTEDMHDGTVREHPWILKDVPARAGGRSGAALAASSTEIVVGSPGLGVAGQARVGEVAPYTIDVNCWNDYDAGWSASSGPRGTPFQGVPEVGDQFGARIAPVTGAPETFVVGAPGETVGSDVGAGAVTVVEVITRVAQELSQDTPGVPGAAEAGDRFGTPSLSLG